jgi:hypothetical protein
MTLMLTPETEYKLKEFAAKHGCDANTVANSLLSDALELADAELEETVAAIDAGWRDCEEGRARPFSEYLEDVKAGRKEPPSATTTRRSILSPQGSDK